LTVAAAHGLAMRREKRILENVQPAGRRALRALEYACAISGAFIYTFVWKLSGALICRLTAKRDAKTSRKTRGWDRGPPRGAPRWNTCAPQEVLLGV
ncbi:hypothetical protein QMN58_25550, partial [Escherichia coli]|nr:hypothetical protein [Escherichia coli]